MGPNWQQWFTVGAGLWKISELLFLACFVCFWICRKRMLHHTCSSHREILHTSRAWLVNVQGAIGFPCHHVCLTLLLSTSTKELVALDFLKFLASLFYKKRGLLDLRARLQDSCSLSPHGVLKVFKSFTFYKNAVFTSLPIAQNKPSRSWTVGYHPNLWFLKMIFHASVRVI